ncbi:MAG: hypothetical protein K6A65_09510 [Succinivibrionaceae bacterium]|nr:hypothetical protein [Succinivibrionaceae bacterium]
MSLKSAFFLLRDGVRFHLARFAHDFTPAGDPAAFNFHALQQALVLKLDGKLGDTEVMTCLYRELRAQVPKMKLAVICPPNLEAIYRDCLHFDTVLTAPRRPSRQEIRALGERLQGVDLALTTEPRFRPRDFLLLHALRPKYVAGLEARARCVNLPLHAPGRSHATDLFLDLLKRGGLAAGEPRYTPLLSAPCLEAVDAQLGGQRVLGINPLGASNKRRLGDEAVLAVARLACESFGLGVFLLCPPRERQLIDSVRAALPQGRLFTLPSPSTPLDLAAAIERCAAVISVDTAAVHLSCASGKPLLAIYHGIKDEGFWRWSPLGDKARLFCREGTLICDLSAGEVAAAAQDFLSALPLAASGNPCRPA